MFTSANYSTPEARRALALRAWKGCDTATLLGLMEKFSSAQGQTMSPAALRVYSIGARQWLFRRFSRGLSPLSAGREEIMEFLVDLELAGVSAASLSLRLKGVRLLQDALQWCDLGTQPKTPYSGLPVEVGQQTASAK